MNIQTNSADPTDMASRCVVFLIGFFGTVIGICGAVDLSLHARPDVPPGANVAFGMVGLACFCLMIAGIVGFQPRRSKQNLANRDAKLLQPTSKPPVLKTTKKHWSGVEHLQSDGCGWGHFLILLGILLGMTLLVVAPVKSVFTSDDSFWTVAGLVGGLILFQLIVAVGWYHLAIFYMQLNNPILSLGVTKNPVALGDQSAVVWEMDGKTSWVKELKFELQGKQVSQDRHSSDHDYIEEVFEIIPFHQTSKSAEIKSGSIMLSIPELTIHSLKSGYDEIVWSIVVKGEIPRWPDMKVSYTIGIVPPEIPCQRLQEGLRQSKNNRAKNSQPVPPVKPPTDKAIT